MTSFSSLKWRLGKEWRQNNLFNIIWCQLGIFMLTQTVKSALIKTIDWNHLIKNTKNQLDIPLAHCVSCSKSLAMLLHSYYSIHTYRMPLLIRTPRITIWVHYEHFKQLFDRNHCIVGSKLGKNDYCALHKKYKF